MAARPQVVYFGALAAGNAGAVAGNQSVAAGALFVINGTLAVNSVGILGTYPQTTQRRVTFTPSGDESGNTFALNGTNWAGVRIGESIVGGNAALVMSRLDYQTVISISSLVATNAVVSIGTNSVAASPWVPLNTFGPSPTTIQVDVTGVVNYTVEGTLDNPNWMAPPGFPTGFGSNNLGLTNYIPVPFNHPNLSGLTASAQDQWSSPQTACRVRINSGNGNVMLSLLQNALVG